jgi:S1-C subfamily serine protease
MTRRSLLLLLVIGSLMGTIVATSGSSLAQGQRGDGREPVAQRESLSQADISRIASSVVYIETEEDGDPFASGSGTIISASGMIFTNRHVVEDGDDFRIYLLEDMAELPVSSYHASLIYLSDEIDFAVLQIDRDDRGRSIDPEDLNLPFLSATSDEVGYGDPVYIFGYPDIGDGYLVLTQGSITTIENGDIDGERLPIWYRTDAEMSSGNSGGLVVNTSGEFIGIPTWVRKAEETLGQLGGILPNPAIQAVMANIDLESETPPNQQDDPNLELASVIIENDSRETICYIYFSPTTSSDWGTDYLGEGNELFPGDSVTFEAEPGTYDLQLEDCDNNLLDDVRDVVLEDRVRLTYDNSGISDAPTRQEATEQTLSIEIQEIEYDAEIEGESELGIKIYTYIRATGYLNVPLRVAVFYYWSDGAPMPGDNALDENRTPGGNLTIQTVITPEYEDTEWDGFWFWMPYSAFPDFRGSKAEGFLQVEIGADGDDFAVFSEEAFFTLND